MIGIGVAKVIPQSAAFSSGGGCILRPSWSTPASLVLAPTLSRIHAHVFVFSGLATPAAITARVLAVDAADFSCKVISFFVVVATDAVMVVIFYGRVVRVVRVIRVVRVVVRVVRVDIVRSIGGA
jgi:hypothetical protein